MCVSSLQQQHHQNSSVVSDVSASSAASAATLSTSVSTATLGPDEVQQLLLGRQVQLQIAEAALQLANDVGQTKVSAKFELLSIARLRTN